MMETDTGFDPSSFLTDGGENMEQEQPTGAPAEEPKPDYVKREDFEKLAADVRAAAVYRAPSIQEQYYQQQPPQQPQQQQNPTEQLERIKKQFTDKIYTDPGQALLEAAALGAQLGAQQAERNLSDRFAPAQETLVGQVTENFITQKQAKDPLFDQVVQRFYNEASQIPAEQVRNIPTNQLRKGLEQMWQKAKGDSYDEVFGKALKTGKVRRPEPPQYGGGASRTFTPAQPKSPGASLGDNFIEIAKSLGMTDEDLNAMAEESE